VIVRILGEGQYAMDPSRLEELNDLDTAVQDAVDAGGAQAFATALRALLDAVRRHGRPLADAELTPSDLVLPDQDTTLPQVRALLTGEGLIPG
jgi:hypothetical protein